MSDKSTWEHFGSENPYFGVSTFEHFRSRNLDEDKLDQFFESGGAYIDEIWKEIETHFVKEFSPGKALDFGCGVGRLAIPLAGKCGDVTGIDISSTMLKEAAKNAKERKISNIEFMEIDGDLPDLTEKFDFVHSFIVLQHIDPKLGERVFEQMIRSLKTNGIGALHLTYFRPGTRRNRLNTYLIRKFPFLFKLRNKLKSEDIEPPIQMHCYDLNSIFKILQDNDCHRCYTRFTFHGLNGLCIIFQKTPGLL